MFLRLHPDFHPEEAWRLDDPGRCWCTWLPATTCPPRRRPAASECRRRGYTAQFAGPITSTSGDKHDLVIAVRPAVFHPARLRLGGVVFVSGLRYKKTVGTVVGQDVVGNDTDQLSAPIVEFETPDGRKIVFTEKVHSNETILDIIGNLAAVFVLKKDPNKVRVLYDPNDPQKARVNNFANLYMFPLVLFIFGLFDHALYHPRL